ncbi:MAG: branched-chain amino acid transport system II carrier protein [Holosporales bacterium]|jgi:LIVCS family branched-chain amino acid:cation transporter|nr:branched-chain amino acid transport system II carrier protein [Holosporales bacterium]
MIKKVTVAGLAVFSMLFGSSNVVFPMIIGKKFPIDWGLADIGWLIATVLIPMIGYYGAMLFEADYRKYLSPIGKHLSAILMFIIMMMVGPFGAIARNINVSFGGINVVSPDVSNVIFNAIYCVIMTLSAWNPGKIVQVIGIIFTPLKFGGVGIVILGALYFCKSNVPLEIHQDVGNAFLEGFKTGYQTMDLLAAFILSSSIYLYIKNALPEEKKNDKKTLLKFCGYSCVIGGVALSIVYTGLVFVSSNCSTLLGNTPDEGLFAKAAEISMGNYASWFVAIVTAICCLATNIALTSIFADYVHEEICRKKFNRQIILVFVGISAFAMSLLGFSTICNILGFVLEKVYPAIIAFVMLRVLLYYCKKPS